jgi:hypothetical protein
MRWPILAVGRSLVLVYVRSGVDPRAILQPEGVGKLKNPVTSAEIEPTTFQFVS